jgi:hypothetical protein
MDLVNVDAGRLVLCERRLRAPFPNVYSECAEPDHIRRCRPNRVQDGLARRAVTERCARLALAGGRRSPHNTFRVYRDAR